MDELYNLRILRLATEIPYLGRLADPQISVTRTSRICGSTVTLDADFAHDRICRLGLEVKACALGQASAALLAPRLFDLDRESLAALRTAFEAMLKQDGPVPAALPDLEIFLPVRAHRARWGAVLLIHDAAIAAHEAAAAVSTR